MAEIEGYLWLLAVKHLAYELPLETDFIMLYVVIWLEKAWSEQKKSTIIAINRGNYLWVDPWNCTQIGWDKMNSLVIFPHISPLTIPILVMIHQPWLKKIAAQLGREAQKAEFVVEIGIVRSWFTPWRWRCFLAAIWFSFTF